jgi:2-polyprenyl-3-methyl-5-hydroxy-6-metoxy-1,4-benzoquinol methylase
MLIVKDSWDDWNDEDVQAVCLVCSLKDTVEQVMQHMKHNHDLDVKALCRDMEEYERMRSVNWMRQQTNVQDIVRGLASTEVKERLKNDDGLLKPVFDDDALLFTDWSDKHEPSELEKALERVKELETAIIDYKDEVRKKFLDADVEEVMNDKMGEEEEDVESYFASYAGIHIHEQMLRDRPRTEAYRDFFYLNKDLFKDKVVLDVGCGTGILSMFAVKAGACKVYAIDNSSILKKAKANVEENGLQDVITLIHDKVEHLQLPEKVDVIVSEWMGYFLLFEGMLDSVLHARDAWLKHGGFLMPSKAVMHLAALSDEEYFLDAVNFWDDVYGFKMTSMREFLYMDGQVESVVAKHLASSPVEMIAWDLNTCTVADLDFETEVELLIPEPCTVHALCGSFDTIFSANFPNVSEVTLSTSPIRHHTHWKQTVFYLKDHFVITKQMQMLKVKMRVAKTSEGSRDLTVSYTVDLYHTKDGEPFGESLQSLDQVCRVR